MIAFRWAIPFIFSFVHFLFVTIKIIWCGNKLQFLFILINWKSINLLVNRLFSMTAQLYQNRSMYILLLLEEKHMWTCKTVGDGLIKTSAPMSPLQNTWYIHCFIHWTIHLSLSPTFYFIFCQFYLFYFFYYLLFYHRVWPCKVSKWIVNVTQRTKRVR